MMLSNVCIVYIGLDVGYRFALLLVRVFAVCKENVRNVPL